MDRYLYLKALQHVLPGCLIRCISKSKKYSIRSFNLIPMGLRQDKMREVNDGDFLMHLEKIGSDVDGTRMCMRMHLKVNDSNFVEYVFTLDVHSSGKAEKAANHFNDDRTQYL